MFLAKLSINRPVATTMGIMVFIIFGAIAYFSLSLNQMPDVEVPYVTIQTIYPGAGPKEIETLISKKIEDGVSTISEIERIESYSLDGVSIIIIEFKLSKDVNVANQEVKDKVDAIINNLPDDAQKPVVQKVDIRAFSIIDVVLSGEADPRELYEIADKDLRDRFSQIEGVAQVNVVGGQEREIRVELDNKTVYENMISMPQLLQILALQNVNIPGGYFQIDDQEYTVRMQGEYDKTESMKNLQVPTAFGYKKLGQIAKVTDGGKDVRQRAVYFDTKNNIKYKNAVKIGIIKSVEGNVVDVADAVKESIPDIQEILPENVKLEIVNDRSIFTKSTVDDTVSNIVLGIVFTSIVLFVFLTHIRSTFIIALSMPASIISTFFLFQVSGLTLNMMSLMGISVTVGVLVANSVVVLENIFRHKKMGRENKDAALIGTTEVTVAVVASTMTNLVVFLPILNMSSMVGRFLRELALSASFATVFSILFSFTLTPMLASLMLPKNEKEGKISAKVNAIYDSWDRWYGKFLEKLLTKKNSLIAIGLTLVIFVISMIFYAPKVGFEFMPQTDDGKIKIDVELPEGMNLEETARTIEEIENRVKKYPEVLSILTNLGKISDIDVGTNKATSEVQLVDANERDFPHSEMISNFVEDLSDIPNAKITVGYGSSMGQGGAPIQFYVLGQDIEKLEELKTQIIDKVKDVPGLINFDNSSRAGKPEITVIPIREKLADAGVTTQELALTLRASIEGLEATKYREKGDEYDITLTVTDVSINSPDKIKQIPVFSSKGEMYSLSQLAEVKFTNGFTKILHRDKYTSILFTGSPATGVPLGNVTSAIDAKIAEIDLPAGYSISWGGNTKMMNDMIADMLFAFILAAILTYMLLAAILESFIQPILILITLPLAMIGVFMALYHTNTSFGVTSLMGLIMLIGIVVNNAILMLDYANQLVREEGMSRRDALIKACPTKLKPILMSTLALVLGMLPMAMGIGDAGKEMRTPLGVVSVGGLLVSTVLTLIVIPALYYLTSRKKEQSA